jgi:uncharacterized cysteine cluster protein YcgN (CxxCxxCC family)
LLSAAACAFNRRQENKTLEDFHANIAGSKTHPTQGSEDGKHQEEAGSAPAA